MASRVVPQHLRALAWHAGAGRFAATQALGVAAASGAPLQQNLHPRLWRALCAAAAEAAAERQSPVEEADEEPTAAYVHLPFCKRKCSYCDFPVIAVGRDLAQAPHVQDNMQRYVEMVVQEIAASRRLNWQPLQSVFFGGGTPSLIPPSLLEQLLVALDRQFGLAAGAEVSIEADPGTFDAARLRAYLGMGVTRVSVGVQALQDELLALCGRAHDVADALRAVEAVHAAGVPSWSLDLMSGLPQLTEEMWGRSLEQALDAGPHHISTYDLQVEEHTPFARRYSPGEAPLPSDESAAAMYRQASAVLRGAGLEHYEVSNFALPGHRCRHNMVYWEGRPFYGLGLGSASYLQGRRFSRPKRLNAYRTWLQGYTADAAAQGPQVAGAWLPRESADDKLLDTVMLRLRLADGLDLCQLAAQHPQGGEAGELLRAALAPHIARGWVIARGGGEGGEREGSAGSSSSTSGGGTADGRGSIEWVRLADPDGFIVSNDIISDCFAALDVTSAGEA
ncbi:hypothetical protein ABPG75_008874 [Micractinium tetrahymenae]